MFGYLKKLGRYLIKSIPVFNILADTIDLIHLYYKYDEDVFNDNYLSVLNLKNHCKAILDNLPLVMLTNTLHNQPNMLPKVLYDSLIFTTTSTAVEGLIEHYYNIKKFFKRDKIK